MNLHLRALVTLPLLVTLLAAAGCDTPSGPGTEPDDGEESPFGDLFVESFARPDAEAECRIAVPAPESSWTLAEDLTERVVRDVSATNDAIFLQSNNRLRRSTDGGATFQTLRSLPVDYLGEVAGAGDDLFVSGYVSELGSRTFRSVDGGETWAEAPGIGDHAVQSMRVNAGVLQADRFVWNAELETFQPLGDNEGSLFIFASDGKTHLGALYGGALRSEDGATWTEIPSLTGVIPTRMGIAGDIGVLIDLDGALYRSADAGLTWAKVQLDAATSGLALDFAMSRDFVYLVTTKGVFASHDGAQTFALSLAETSEGHPSFFDSTNRLALRGDLLVFTGRDIVRSNDHGASWEASAPLLDATPFALGVSDAYVFASTLDMRVHLTDDVVDWHVIESDGYAMSDFARDPSDGATYMLLSSAPPHSMAMYPDGEIVKSTNGGQSFETYIERPRDGYMATYRHIHVHDGALFLGGDSTVITVGQGPGLIAGPGVFRSTDGGDSWDRVNVGLPSTSSHAQYGKLFPAVVGFHSQGEDLFVALAGSGVFRSTDDGDNWQDVSAGLPGADPQSGASIDTFATAAGGAVLATSRGFYSGLYGFDAAAGSWQPVRAEGLPDGFVIDSFHSHGSVVFAAVRSLKLGQEGVYASADGVTWSPVGALGRTRSLATAGDLLLAGTDGNGLYSLDLGACEPQAE